MPSIATLTADSTIFSVADFSSEASSSLEFDFLYDSPSAVQEARKITAASKIEQK